MFLERSGSRQLVKGLLVLVALAGISESRAQQVAPGPAAEEPAQVTEVIRLRSLEADKNLQGTLSMLLSGRSRIAVDQRTNSVIIQSDEKQLKIVKDLLAALDVPVAWREPDPALQDRQVRIVWLMSGIKDGGAIPKDLMGIVEELSRYGVTDLQLLAQTIVRGRETFTTSAYPDLDENPVSLQVSGSFSEGQSPSHVQMEISLNANSTLRGESLAQLETTVLTPFDHPVVLCMNPVKKMTSVFIVEVRLAP